MFKVIVSLFFKWINQDLFKLIKFVKLIENQDLELSITKKSIIFKF